MSRRAWISLVGNVVKQEVEKMGFYSDSSLFSRSFKREYSYCHSLKQQNISFIDCESSLPGFGGNLGALWTAASKPLCCCWCWAFEEERLFAWEGWSEAPEEGTSLPRGDCLRIRFRFSEEETSFFEMDLSAPSLPLVLASASLMRFEIFELTPLRPPPTPLLPELLELAFSENERSKTNEKAVLLWAHPTGIHSGKALSLRA